MRDEARNVARGPFDSHVSLSCGRVWDVGAPPLGRSVCGRRPTVISKIVNGKLRNQ